MRKIFLSFITKPKAYNNFTSLLTGYDQKKKLKWKDYQVFDIEIIRGKI